MTPRCTKCGRATGFRRRPRGLCRTCLVIGPVEDALNGNIGLLEYPRLTTSIITRGVEQFYTVVSHRGMLELNGYVNIDPGIFCIIDIGEQMPSGVTLRLRQETSSPLHIPAGTPVRKFLR